MTNFSLDVLNLALVLLCGCLLYIWHFYALMTPHKSSDNFASVLFKHLGFVWSHRSIPVICKLYGADFWQ